MAILVDSNQLFISGIMANLTPRDKLEEGLVRHIVLNTLRSNVKKFKEYGEIIICCDNKKYWRKEYFPYYKAHRTKDREKSDWDWGMIFRVLNVLRDDLKTHFPYKVIDVDGAEADDVIGTLTPRLALHEPVLILSSDKDFIQLQKYNNVKQYNPMLNAFVTSQDPKKDLKEKIIRGDRGDCITNIFSDEVSILEGKRQKSISAKNLEIWMDKSPEECFEGIVLERYKRNEVLISFDFIPEEIRQNIVNVYETVEKGNKQKLYNYMVENKLISLLEVIDEF